MAEKNSVNKILRVLILDESPDDAEQASAVLRQAGYMLKTQRLETGVAVEKNLDNSQWDLVLCGHGMPNLTARQVVELVTHKQPFTPVIVLARRIADDELRQLMLAGARDVIIKGQWGRLLPAVERELAVANERRAWTETRASMDQLEARYRSMIEASLEAISYVQDGMHMDANPSYLRLFGYEDINLLKETPLLNLIDKQDQARFKAALRKPEGAEKSQEFLAVAANGKRIPIEVALNPLVIHGEQCVQVVATDISKRKALETKLQSIHQRDPLTGLSNRTHFVSALGETLKTPGGVLFGITVNQLAALNQALGHTACDRLLVQIARQLRELAGDHTPIARITGGQFAVLLDAKAAAGAGALAQKIKQMASTLSASDADRSMKPDVAIQQLQLEARHKDKQAIMDEVFKAEAQAMPTAPKAARVAAVPTAPVTPATSARIQSAQSHTPILQPVLSQPAGDWGTAVQNALAHNQMQLLFQPIINLHGDPRCLYEAQFMLRTLDGKVITSSEYLPSAEALGLGGKIDRSLMLNVIDTLSKYRLDGRPGTVFVGLTSAAVQDNALLAAIQMHIKATGLDPSDLILQLDEAVLGQHPDAARHFIESARSMGMGICLDNFTSQVMDAESLAALNIDYYGINCGLDGLKEDALVNSILTALSLEKLTVAKRIEDDHVFTELFTRGVHYVQGDYLQPASPGLDYSFESEQTLASDVPSGPTWRVAG